MRRNDAPRLEERLHKVLAQAGLGSRRALEQRIADGLVKVNGEVAQTGMSVKGGDKIELDGRQLRRQRADRTGARADLQQARRRSHHARGPRRPARPSSRRCRRSRARAGSRSAAWTSTPPACCC
jgi:ribosomal 50S subunit-recycling heat shock protein